MFAALHSSSVKTAPRKPIYAALGLILLGAVSQQLLAQTPSNPDKYRRAALNAEGNVERGQKLFSDEARIACSKCHSIDGKAGKAGPDLFAVGDKFTRSDLIEAILNPSATIAVGYGMTIVDLKSGEEVQGIIQELTSDYLQIIGADGKSIRIPNSNIASKRGSTVSLMPEGLQNGLSTEEFTDLIQYLTTLRQPENTLTSNRGMPDVIPALAKPIELIPFFNEQLRVPKSDVQTGLTGMIPLPGSSNSFLVIHQSGIIWRMEKKDSGDQKAVFADLTSEVFYKRGPNGLQGLAFHPKFKENRKYYLKYQVFEDGVASTIVVEKHFAPNLRDDSGEAGRRLLKIVSVAEDHSGGNLEFGPDGYLYFAMGDTGPHRDPNGHAQNLNLLLGKMLRIDVDKSEDGKAYAIPQDNPFRGVENARPEIWAYGFRNPWQFSFDTATGDLWLGDVGQDRVDEIDLVRRGENFGWNVYEGFEPFSNQYRKEGVTYTLPVFAYKRKHGISVTGGLVYHGKKGSSFDGVYIFGDYSSKRIFGLTQENRKLKTIRQIGTSPQGIVAFSTNDQGEILIVGFEGTIYKLNLEDTAFE
jgi:putative heme-binding domain-containing protein